MNYWEHHNQLNMHTKSKISNDWKPDLYIHYKLGNLLYDEKSLTHTVIINKKLQLTFQFQHNECQFHVTFYFGRFFKNKVYTFNLKLNENEADFLKKIAVNQDKNTILDQLSYYIIKVVNNCPFIYAKKDELKFLASNGIKDFYGFERTAIDFSVNNDRDTQIFRCYISEDKNFQSSVVYNIYCNQLRQIYKNIGFDLIDNHMKIKQKLVKVPYFVSKRINHDDWFLIADFSNKGTGFLANNNGEYIYILKHNQYSYVVKGTDKEFALKDLLSKYSLDYFKYNKIFNDERIDNLFNEFGLDADNLTEKDFEIYSMYEY